VVEDVLRSLPRPTIDVVVLERERLLYREFPIGILTGNMALA
jgi:hypothetical protein